MTILNFDGEKHLLTNDDEDICPECGDPCEWVAECFDYSGTHCTNGKGGTHYTGRYLSDCCDAEPLD